MLRTRKAQAAMEFLMTYGWAILVVLIVIGALAYFGVLNPQRLLPSRCTFPTGISCKDFIVDSGAGVDGEIRIEILNGLGRTINITSMGAAGVAGNTVDCDTEVGNSTLINNGDSKTITLACPGGGGEADPNVKWRWELNMTWYYRDSDVTFAKTYSGELFTAVD